MVPKTAFSCEQRLEVKPGWHEHPRQGYRAGPDVCTYDGGQYWTPVVWDSEQINVGSEDEPKWVDHEDDEDRLGWFKACALQPVQEGS